MLPNAHEKSIIEPKVDVYKRQIKDPKKVEMELWKIIPPEKGSDFCHRLVYHGREVCTARTTPYCDRCCLNDICKKKNI